MAAFDAKKYKQDVLKPNSRGEGFEQLREVLQLLGRDPSSSAYTRLNLNELFAVPTPVTATELNSWKTSIVSTLNKSGQIFPSAKLLSSLLEILGQQGKDLTDPAFWGELQSERQKETLAALETGMQQLRAEYPLGVVTAEELTARLAAIGVSGVTEGSIRTVAKREQLTLHPQVELPVSGMPSASLENSWQSVTKEASYHSILDILLLHAPERLKGATFIDHLTVGSKPLGPADVRDAHEKADKSKDTNDIQLAKKFLGVLKNEVTDNAKLQEIVMIALTALVRSRISRGQPVLTVRDHLMSIGLDSTDASRIVAAVDAANAGSGGAGAKLGLEQVRELLSRGQLAEAERTLTAISPDGQEPAEYKQLTAQVTKLKTKKEQALERFHAAMQHGDFHAASAALVEAMAVDPADDVLAALHDTVPPAPPRSFKLRMNNAAVVLDWAQESDPAVTYTVVRTNGRAPTSVNDGTRLASNLSAITFTDEAPPSASLAGYAVFATRDGRLFSVGTGAEVTVLPVPNGLHAATDLTSARLSWAAPAGSSGSVVTRLDPNGKSIDIDVLSGSTLQIDGLVKGANYRFAVRAIYLLDSGRHLSEPASITVVPRGVATAVRDLQVTVISGAAGREELKAIWSPSEGFETELWSFHRNVGLPEGSSVNAAQLKGLGGHQLSLLAGSGDTQARLAAFTEVVKVAPLTVTGEGYLVGYSVMAGSSPQASDIVAELFGDELRVSWDWPEGDYIIELSWRDADKPRTRRITRTRYRAEGGAVLANASVVSELKIATVVRIDDDEWASTGVPVELAPNGPVKRANYRIQIKKTLLGGKVSCQIGATTDRPGFSMPVEVVLKLGKVMPFSADDGERLEQFNLDFTTSPTFSHTVVVGKAKSPFWVCLFAQDDSELIPPSTSELKG